MIITEKKPIEEILDALKDDARIFLVGCGECATVCKTGGKEELAGMEAVLKERGKEITGVCIPDAPCLASQVKAEFAKNMAALRRAQAILVLSCGLGAQSVKENDRLGLEVIPACNTLFSAIVDTEGDFIEKCSLCGECMLSETGGICPVTLCPKGLLNGPCGGMDKGKCEVDKDKDCAWVMIYKELEKRQAIGKIKEIHKPRDYKKSLRPRRISLSHKNGTISV